MPSVQLPPELVADVLDTFVLSSPSHAARIPNLASFAVVSRKWHAAATPLLYRNLYLDSRRRGKILDALEGNEALLPVVRELSLSGGGLSGTEHEPDAEYARLKRVLTQCGNVQRLSYHCFDASTLLDLTWFVSDTWPTLRYLRADQSAHLFDLLGRLPALETLIASSIEVPAQGGSVTPRPPPSPPSAPSRSPSPGSTRTSTPGPPTRPTFRLKRLDSGSSPRPSDFQLLTSSSASTLRSLDLPLSSLTSQDLSSFTSLERLTLTLAERYLPLPVPGPGPGPGQPATTRNDARLVRRLRHTLDRVSASGAPLRVLEVHEPHYAATAPIAAGALFPEEEEEEDGRAGAGFLDAVPRCVERLELQTLEALEARDIARAFASASARGAADGEGERRARSGCCDGLRQLVLARKVALQDGAGEMRRVLEKRGVEVVWE